MSNPLENLTNDQRREMVKMIVTSLGITVGRCTVVNKVNRDTVNIMPKGVDKDEFFEACNQWIVSFATIAVEMFAEHTIAPFTVFDPNTESEITINPDAEELSDSLFAIANMYIAEESKHIDDRGIETINKTIEAMMQEDAERDFNRNVQNIQQNLN